MGAASATLAPGRWSSALGARRAPVQGDFAMKMRARATSDSR
jgi:hypothetical protein